MTNISPETVLQRVPDLTVRIDSSNLILVSFKSTEVACGPHGLAILDEFYRPTSLAQALERLRARVPGAQDWIDMTSSILRLCKAGVLREEAEIVPTLAADPFNFDAAPV